MNNTIYNPDQGIQIANNISPVSNSQTYGTHFSHNGVGGYMELPTLNDMYDIPAQPQSMSANMFSTGRRKYGMLVYVMETKQWFQLLPRDKTTHEYLTYAQYQALSEQEKHCALNPMAYWENIIFDDDTGEEVSRDVFSGSQIKEECWTEVSLSDHNLTFNETTKQLSILGGNTISLSAIANISVANISEDKTFANTDNGKIFHFNTSTNSLTAIFPSSLNNGFSTVVMNVGTNTLFLSASQLNSAGTKISTIHSGAFIYKDSNNLFAVGKLV